ncbi:MAG: thiol:disulfide interchange protein DsbA/DsbL [Steroidobacteraceae bacterium]
MNKFLLATLALSAVLAGCGRDATPVTETAPVTEPAPAATPAGAEPSTAELQKAAQATQESGAAPEAAGDATLERIAAMPEGAQLPGGRWKAGTNYAPIVPAQATAAEPGQVEVLEVLWLGCPHCYELNPYMEAFKKKKPAYVKFTQEHVMWGPAHRAHAKLFYTLEALGRDDLIAKAFDEIHRRGNNLVAANDTATATMHAAFAKANGISDADFKREYNGFAVNTRLQRAEELMRRYRVESVPLFIINGKYRTDVSMAGGADELVQLLGDLAASEKSR